MEKLTEELAIPKKQPVIGVGISTTSYSEAASIFATWIQRNRVSQQKEALSPARYVCVTTAYSIVSAVLNAPFKSILNAADMATPDGMPVVWALRSFGWKKQERVYGPDLMLTLCRQAELFGHRIYLYGGHEESLKQLALRLQALFHRLVIAGAFSPPFRQLTPEEDAEIVRKIGESHADIVFVGLGAPKQEVWMSEHRSTLPNTVLVGVGAAFDFHAGRIRQAPAWMQKAGLEWFFRLIVEPRRLWKRYLIVTPLFIPLWAMQKLGLLRARFPLV